MMKVIRLKQISARKFEYVPKATRSTSKPAITDVISAPLLQKPLIRVIICLFVLSWKKKPCEFMEIWKAEIAPPWMMMNTRKSKVEVLWVKKTRLIPRAKAAIWSIQRAPYLWTRWPIVRRATRLPIAPMLTREPNSPLVSLRLALTSGKRGTQDIIKSPKRKKSALSRFNSCSTPTVFFKTVHWQALYELPPIVGHFDQPRQKD